MKIITGAAGFIGSNVLKRLNCYGVDDLSFGVRENVEGYESSVAGIDFADIGDSFLNKHDVLIHLATSNMIFAMDEPIKTFETNALKTIRLFQRFKGKIIYTSTTSVYGNADIFPTPETAELKVRGAYDMSKLLAEMFLAQRGNYTTLRLSNVYGTNQRPTKYGGVIGKLIHQAISGKPMEVIGTGTQTRDFTCVDDVVDAIELAVNQEAKNTEINIATATETTILSLAKMIREEIKTKSYIVNTPLRQIDYLDRRCINIQKAKELLGWTPKHTLKQGLEKTIKWMYEYCNPALQEIKSE